MDPSRPLPPDELVFGDFVRALMARWRRLVAASVGGAAIALGAALVWPETYTAEVSFTPEQSSSGSLTDALGSLSGGIGSLVGMPGGLPAAAGGSSTSSPDFFASVLKSRELLVSTLESPFRDPDNAARLRPLIDLLRPRGASPARRAGNARRKLDQLVKVAVERRTGLVTLRVTQRDPQLAADVANRMTELLNGYNLERRQSSSREQRTFIEARLAQAEQELRAAEQAQTSFLLENRLFRSAPALQERAARLTRNVLVRQELVLGLRKSFEDARIAEVRDTPVLSIVDHAAPPDRASNPRPLLWTALGAMLGLLLGVARALFASTRERDAVQRARGELGTRDTSSLPPEATIAALVPSTHPEGWVASARRP